MTRESDDGVAMWNTLSIWESMHSKKNSIQWGKHFVLTPAAVSLHVSLASHHGVLPTCQGILKTLAAKLP